MDRISLKKRLCWLKNSHADHLDYIERRMRSVAAMPMVRYFAPYQNEMVKLAGHLHMDVEAVKRMTYLEVVRVIHRMIGNEKTRAAAILSDNIFNLASRTVVFRFQRTQLHPLIPNNE